jgi:hypothetical protein
MDSIDYSPHPSVKKTTLVLHESELRTASHHQFVRFFRVWCVESHTYAPLLESLKIILCPEPNDGSSDIVGINKFLQYAMEYRVYESEWVSVHILDSTQEQPLLNVGKTSSSPTGVLGSADQ